MREQIGSSEDTKTLAGQTFARLLADLKANRFQPGARLRFDDMRSLYEVGVAPLREALCRLTEAGHVVQIGQKGFRVAPASINDLTHVVATRRLLELQALRAAMADGDDGWEANLVAAFHRFSKAAKRKPDNASARAAWEESHTAFHRALIAGCANRWILHFWSTIFDQAERYRRLAIESGHWSEDELKDHQRLMQAALDRDEELACALLHEHIGQSAERLVGRLNPLLLESDSPVDVASKRSRATKAFRE